MNNFKDDLFVVTSLPLTLDDFGYIDTNYNFWVEGLKRLRNKDVQGAVLGVKLLMQYLDDIVVDYIREDMTKTLEEFVKKYER